MRLNYLEIATLYVCALTVGARICVVGYIYHDLVIITAGALISAFTTYRTGEAILWWGGYYREEPK